MEEKIKVDSFLVINLFQVFPQRNGNFQRILAKKITLKKMDISKKKSLQKG